MRMQNFLTLLNMIMAFPSVHVMFHNHAIAAQNSVFTHHAHCCMMHL